MPTLYYAPGACSMAVHIVLEWIGEPYEAVKVDQHHPDFLKINPAGAVPALDYGGEEALTQASAVLTYLARKHPAADLLDERSPEVEAQLQRWAAFLTGDLHPAFFPAFASARYTTATEPAALGEVKAAALLLIHSKLTLLEQHMRGREWVVGDKRTIVDAYLTPMLRWAKGMLPEGLAAFPWLEAHSARLLADPAVRRVMAAEGL